MKNKNLENDFEFTYKSLIEYPVVFGYAERGTNVLNKSIRIIKKLFLEVFSLLTSQATIIPRDKYLFICLTNNQYDAVVNIFNNIKEDSLIISPQFFSKVTRENKRNIMLKRLPFFFKNIYTDIKIAKIKFGSNYRDQFINVFYNSGLKKAYINFFKRFKPKALIFSNEATPHLRTVMLAAKELKIPTVFIQHAAASRFYPKLEFDYAFLEGQYSHDVYRISGTTKVSLVGMSKFDYILKKSRGLKPQTKIKTIGIAINLLDTNYDLITELIAELISLNYNVHFRPHPSLYPYPKKIDCYKISNPFKESTQEFLNQIDVLISGNSSIHLEAALLNITSIHFNFTHKTHQDYYDFIKNGLSVKSNLQSISKLLSEQIESRYLPKEKTKYYNAAVGTNLEGNTSDFIANEILKL